MNLAIFRQKFLLICLLSVAPQIWAQSFEPDETTKIYLDLWRQGQYEKAFDHLEGEIHKSVDGVPIHWLQDRTQLLFDLGRVHEAVADLEWLHQRRPTPNNTLQLAEFYFYTGRRTQAFRILNEIQNRFRRATRYEDDTDNDLALHRIREYLGENPRELFRSMLVLQPREKPKDHLKRYVAAGNLAFRKFDYALGASYFEKALDIDENHLEAKAGLADCYWKSGDARLGPMLEAVLAENPIHPRAKAIEAEMKLDNKKPVEALELIQQVLEVNPTHLKFLGLKAGALFLMDDLEGMADIFTQAVRVNHAASIVYRIAGRVASRHYRFEEGADLQLKALALDTNDHHARALYAFDLLRLGRDKEGREQLEMAFEQDRFNVQVYNMLELMDTLETFTVIERGPFIIKMPANEAPIWGAQALDLVEEAAKRFEKKYKHKLRKPVTIQFFDNHDDFMVRSVGLPGSVGHLGICFGSLITMDSPTARNKWGMNWSSVLWHEFVHVITLQKTNNRMSRWLSEGISVYEEVMEEPAWSTWLDPRFKGVVEEDGVPGLRDMEPLFTTAKSSAHLMFGYYAAGEFVKFYVDRYGWDKLVTALDLIAAKMSTEDALLEASGDTEKEMNKSLKAFLEKGFKPFEYLPEHNRLEPAPNVRVSEAGQAGVISPFTDALRKGDRAFSEKDWPKAEKAYLEALEMFPNYTGDDSAVQKLIQLYETTGNETSLKEMLLKAFSIDGTDFKTSMMLVDLYRDKKDWQGVINAARRGLDIDPFDVGMNKALMEGLEQKKNRDSLKIAERLIRLDQHRAIDYRLKRIDLLMDFDDEKKARYEAIRLLEEAPYSWEAQRRLLKLVDGEQ